ncbi:hypothetical protein IWX91DRAFT_408389, partial [Phyllosticta citricarpa]
SSSSILDAHKACCKHFHFQIPAAKTNPRSGPLQPSTPHLHVRLNHRSLSQTLIDRATHFQSTMAPRFKGHAGFDFKLFGLDGAIELLDMIGHDPKQFQGIRSLYVGVTVEGLDEYVDDMLAAALNMISPGNVPHSLERLKVSIAGIDYMEMHAESICSPAASRHAPYQSIMYNRDPPASLLESPGVVHYKSERAFIRALLNIRGVQRVEVEGPMPAELKKRIGACLTTRPGYKVRSWKGEQSAFRTDAEIGWGLWVASMQSRDEALDNTVGPDGVELVDTTALHHGLDVSFHVSLPVPPSPRPEDDRTIWNKPPFRFPSPPCANDNDDEDEDNEDDEDEDNENDAASAPRRRACAAIATTYAEESQDSFGSSITSDPQDDDFIPDTSSPIKSSPLKRRSSTPMAADWQKRLCTRLRPPPRGGSLSSAALDAYDAKRALGFPASPAGTLHRVNYAAAAALSIDDSDFGRRCDDVEPSKRMTWFRGNRRAGQRQWVLPTSRGAKVSVARRVEREGRRHIVAARRSAEGDGEIEGSRDEDDVEEEVLSDVSNSSAREGDSPPDAAAAAAAAADAAKRPLRSTTNKQRQIPVSEQEDGDDDLEAATRTPNIDVDVDMEDVD